MAAPQARSWANLHAACLLEIFCRIPCAEDRHSAYRACPAWLEALKDCRPRKEPPALPWLLLPAPNPNDSTRVVCVLSGCCVHQDHHYPTIIPRGARCFGSHDGAWLFVHYGQTDSHALVNLRTGDVHDIPVDILIPTNQHSYSFKIIIHAAALSSSPDDANCVAISIGTAVLPPRFPCVTLWRKGWPHAVQIRPPGFQTGFAEDVVYHDGAFYLLHTNGDHISVCTPELLPDNRCREEWENRRFHPGGRIYDQFVRSRYLVSSRGELLLVVRFTPHPNEPTSKFMVFRAIERPQNPDADADADSDFPVAAYPWAWSELDTLDGRILFVGYGCSRSYEVDDAQGRIQYMGFKAGIYFLDDGEFYDVAVILGNGNVTQYPCNDNGWWSGSRVQSCFPLADPSGHSPPARLLH